MLVPSGWLSLRGCIQWVDRAHLAAGVALERTDARAGHVLATAMLAFAFEFESQLPTALLLIDDDELVAELCEPLRAGGYVPRAFRTALDAVVSLEQGRSPPGVAIVSARALDHTASEWLHLLAQEDPAFTRLMIAEADGVAARHADGELPFDGLLAASAPRLALEAMLGERQSAAISSTAVQRGHRRPSRGSRAKQRTNEHSRARGGDGTTTR